LEVWEKVLINADAVQKDVHGYIPCTQCHGGQNVDDKTAAHEGLVRDPSADAMTACGSCHKNIAPYQEYSLHYNLAGYDTVLYQRSVPENHPVIEEGQSYHCNDCHATCGQCHISQPTSVGGGLVNGHTFTRTPSMSRQCTACHGSRVKNEYTGAHEGIPADVHLRVARMTCTDCHTGDDMHGTDYVLTGQIPAHRYDGAQAPACEDCHQDDIAIGQGNEYHDAHGTQVLSCQVCHSTTYINCTDCHLQQSDEGVPFYRLEHEELAFTIGRNPLRSSQRPYRYVPVRHVPTFPDLFAFYGEDVLSNFDALPTWTYATPHNIQLRTPQTETCESCHGNDDYFLTPDKVPEEFRAANASVIVPFAPPLPERYEYRPGQETAPASSTDPLDAPPPTVDPLDMPAVDPLDAPPPTVDPLDAPAVDPLDAPPPTVDPLDAPPGG
jgi:thiosulfate/3-mercaptopyruvate sulfurtransferase